MSDILVVMFGFLVASFWALFGIAVVLFAISWVTLLPTIGLLFVTGVI